jgi:hypothetical protein
MDLVEAESGFGFKRDDDLSGEVCLCGPSADIGCLGDIVAAGAGIENSADSGLQRVEGRSLVPAPSLAALS